MKNILIAFLVSLPFYSKAQDYPIVYLDAGSRETDKNKAMYYRTVENSGDMFTVNEYYVKTDKLRMTAICSSINPRLVYEGEVTTYFENGEIREIGNYKEGKPVGISRSYYSSGQQKNEVIHKDKVTLYCKAWDTDGKPLLNDGTGTIQIIRVIMICTPKFAIR